MRKKGNCLNKNAVKDLKDQGFAKCDNNVKKHGKGKTYIYKSDRLILLYRNLDFVYQCL